MTKLLVPEADDYIILKPKHYPFYASPLETILNYIGARVAIVAAAQFFQGAQSALSVIHRFELAATQQLRQLSRIDPITLAAIFQQGVLSRIANYQIADVRL
jgi:hypothetical protein